LIAVKVLYVTLGHCAEDFLLLFLIFLANRFNSAYYPVLITGDCGPVSLEQDQVDVLCWVVENSAKFSGLRRFTQYFVMRRN
jgi:hypothetical protein